MVARAKSLLATVGALPLPRRPFPFQLVGWNSGRLRDSHVQWLSACDPGAQLGQHAPKAPGLAPFLELRHSLFEIPERCFVALPAGSRLHCRVGRIPPCRRVSHRRRLAALCRRLGSFAHLVRELRQRSSAASACSKDCMADVQRIGRDGRGVLPRCTARADSRRRKRTSQGPRARNRAYLGAPADARRQRHSGPRT